MTSSRTTSSGGERRLAAILFTDIVGYTALMAESEDAGRRARERHRALVRPLVEEHAGEAIEARGDESLSVFSTARDAVSCALAIQDALRGDPVLKLHLGIHLGDVTLEHGEVSGDGVNIAARLCALSVGGGLCVSGEVYQAVRNQPDMEAVPLGDHDLKNVGRLVAVYALGRPGAVDVQVPRPARGRGPIYALAAAVLLVALAGVWWSSRPAVLAPIRSLAVLPLDNPSAGPDDAYLSFGMTEALIAELARVDDLRVISRTSVTPFEDSDLPLREIAAQLGVDGIIEGSILRSGDHVRVTAQLIDARTDHHLWAESFDRELGDALALQAEVAREIARQVRLEVAPSSEAQPMSPEAYEAYLKGYFFQMKRTREDTLRALDYFNKVIALEPDHPLGYSGLADEYSCAPTHSWSITESQLWPSVPREMIGRARESAQRAVELDPSSGPAHNSVALVRMFGDWDWPGAEAEIKKAIELSPGRAWAHSTYALLLGVQRRFDEALVHQQEARALDPLRSEEAMNLAALRAWTGDVDGAYRWWQSAREIDPTYPGLHQTVIVDFCGGERHTEALSALQGAVVKYPDDPPVLAQLAYCHAAVGEAERARQLLAEIEALSDAMYVSPVSRAMVHVGLGEQERAFELLEQGFHDRAFSMLYLNVDRLWDPLRGDPRFTELLERIGLPA